MCNIKGDYHPTEPVTGYKVAIKIDGKYYSPATGVEYKPGPVERAYLGTIRSKPKVYGGFIPASELLDPDDRYYNASYVGLTAVFNNVEDANKTRLVCEAEVRNANPHYIRGYLTGDIVVLEMTLGDVKYTGTYNISYDLLDRDVVMGKTIVSIKEIKRSEPTEKPIFEPWTPARKDNTNQT